MPTLSVIASGPSLWMPLDDEFHDSISNVAVSMASIQRDAILIRIALVPSVHPMIVYTLRHEISPNSQNKKKKIPLNFRED